MSDTQSQTNSASEADPTGGSPDAGAAADGGAGGTEESNGSQSGSVSADLTRAQETIRNLQSERDRLRAERDSLTAAASSGSGDGAGSSGEFDPDAFRRSLMQDVLGATALQTAAVAIRQEFPHADPSLFTGERLAGFGSPDALRLAAQADHLRVAAQVEAAVEAREAALRAEMEAKYGSGAGSANGGGESGGTGDPTPQQVAAMSLDELDALEKSNPGVLDRVLRSALT